MCKLLQIGYVGAVTEDYALLMYTICCIIYSSTTTSLKLSTDSLTINDQLLWNYTWIIIFAATMHGQVIAWELYYNFMRIQNKLISIYAQFAFQFQWLRSVVNQNEM